MDEEKPLGQGESNPSQDNKSGGIKERASNALSSMKNISYDKAKQAAKQLLKNAFKKTIVQAGAWIIATFGWWLIPIVLIIVGLFVAIILFFSSLNCSGGRCQPNTPTGTKEDKRQTAKIEALVNPKNTNYAAMISNDIRSQSEAARKKLEAKKSSAKTQAEKDAIDGQITNLSEIIANMDQLILSQGTSDSSSLNSIFNSIAAALAKLIYSANGGVVSQIDEMNVALPLNPNDINGFGKDAHGFSELKHEQANSHNVFKSIYNSDFGDQGRYADAADISAPAGSTVYAPLTGTAFVFDRDTNKERIEIITDDNKSSVLLAHIKVNSTEARFKVNAGDEIGTISDKTKNPQLQIQLNINTIKYTRVEGDTGDSELWIRMELALSGNPANAQDGSQDSQRLIQELKNILQ